MHDLNNMSYSERKDNIHAVFLLYLFVGISLLQCSFSFLADFRTFFWKGVNYCHKIIHDNHKINLQGALNSLQYVPT